MRLLMVLLFLPCVASTVTLDEYGGREDMHCVGGVTGVWYPELIGAQWYLCTPAGHPMWAQGAYVAGPQISTDDKYGTGLVAFQQTINRMKSWGFNLNPPYTNINMLPYATGMSSYKMPYLFIFRPGFYGMMKHAVAGPIDDGIKDLVNSAPSYFNYFNFSGGMVDWADIDRMKVALHYMTSTNTNDFATVLNGKIALDYLVGIALEDSDQTASFWGAINQEPFETRPSGKGRTHGGYIAAIISPQQQANAVRALLYTDHEVKTKTHWQAYLQDKYTTIGALNTAWSTSGAYTTWGSTATTVTAEAFGTTDGVNGSFTHTLANAGTVSPGSIQIYEDGTMIAGDCFQPSTLNSCNPASGWGGVYGPTASGGSVNYSAKVVTLNYSGTFKILDSISCSGATCAATVNVYDDAALGVSVGDKIATRFSTCCSSALETVSAKSTSAPCGGGANCYTYTYSNNAANSGYEAFYGTPRFINLQMAKLVPPTTGKVLTVNYQVNGWGAGGTGLMDEDGRTAHQAWLGTGLYGFTDSNANFTIDARAWLGELAVDYFGAMSGQISDDFTAVGAAVPMFVGPDSAGTWSTPPAKEVLQAMATYCPIAIMSTSEAYPTFSEEELDFVRTWYGKPYFTATFLHSQADSPFSAHPMDGDFATQELRGASFYASIQSTLAIRNGGVNPYLGSFWWQYGDNAVEQTNWGLVTLKDNAYDGHESVTGTVACSAPLAAYSCGGEAGNYGDVITSVKAANALWLQDIVLTDRPVVRGGVRMAVGTRVQ
jgi:hypothetical protein